jgi:hypothetical protein
MFKKSVRTQNETQCLSELLFDKTSIVILRLDNWRAFNSSLDPILVKYCILLLGHIVSRIN